MAKIDPVQLQNQLDMISKDSDNIPIITFPISKIENITKEFESVTKELAAEREKTRILEARLNVLDNAHT